MYWPFVVGVFGLALLMVVHEGGHHLAARAFGMRVIKFSIGFGPAIWRHQPRGSETVYQVALIPFLAYVQIAGMNPMEDVDPNDAGSYANASLIGRITTIFAGPLANYLFASVLFFAAFMIGGEAIPTTQVKVLPDSAASAAEVHDGDKVVSIDDRPIADFEQMRSIVQQNPNKPLKFGFERQGKPVSITITPRAKGKDGGGLIGVEMQVATVPMPLRQAALRSVVWPAVQLKAIVVGLARIVTGKEKAQLTGPPGIVREVGKAAALGLDSFFGLLGFISTYLAAFNLVPFPGLDGGRLTFLLYEAVTRRRANARIEAHVHALGVLMLLAVIAVVSVFDLQAK